MKCPFCGALEDRVVDSRPTDEGDTVRRRRECAKCYKRFTTYEKVEILPLVVIKKDNTRENFSRDKLMRGILRACEKRPIATDEMHKIVDEIETHLSNSLEREVSSQIIGELLMDRLKRLDQVAYVRFASVYRDFGDIDTFIDEIHKIRTEENPDLSRAAGDDPPQRKYGRIERKSSKSIPRRKRPRRN
jgi:transcriptional repressor NrdR